MQCRPIPEVILLQAVCFYPVFPDVILNQTTIFSSGLDRVGIDFPRAVMLR